MEKRYSPIVIASFLGILTMAASSFPIIIESIDTTDQNGYSRDSLFKIANIAVFQPDSGRIMIAYDAGMGSHGYFNCPFDDLSKAPDSLNASSSSLVSIRLDVTYVILRLKDSTCSKMVLLNKLSDGRYIYRQVTNTKPNERLFIQGNYNPTIKYKPNNLFFTTKYVMPATVADLSWEPPLPGNNHLLGYTVYFSKVGVAIDTAKPINMTQWDSVAFTTNTAITVSFRGVYLNLVAVYQEGKSDFLKGWVREEMLIGIKPSAALKSGQKFRTIATRKSAAGYYFTFSSDVENEGPFSAAIFDPTGRMVSRINSTETNQPVWNSLNDCRAEGVYIVQVILPHGIRVVRQFMVTK